MKSFSKTVILAVVVGCTLSGSGRLSVIVAQQPPHQNKLQNTAPDQTEGETAPQDPGDGSIPESPVRRLQSWYAHREVFPNTLVQAPNPNAQVQAPCPTQSAPAARAPFGSSINPGDVNYGGLLSAWRLELVDQTVTNLYFYVVLFLLIAVMILTAYVAYLTREKARRLRITSDIVCQLWNGWSTAHDRAMGAILEHNAWVERMDRDDNGALPSEVSEPRILRPGLIDTIGEVPATAIRFTTARNAPADEDNTSTVKSTFDSLPLSAASRFSIDSAMPTASIVRMETQLDQTLPDEPTAPSIKEQRLVAQNKALEEKIGNLQRQLNKEKERQAIAESTGE